MTTSHVATVAVATDPATVTGLIDLLATLPGFQASWSTGPNEVHVRLAVTATCEEAAVEAAVSTVGEISDAHIRDVVVAPAPILLAA